jgi:glutathione synthase/RimK-type ligase-like ATP-grasp enzyme
MSVQVYGAAGLETGRPLSVVHHPLVIHYEHPRWFDRLFAELDRRGIDYTKSLVSHHVFDPAAEGGARQVIFNRMSPSAWRRGEGSAIGHTLAWLKSLERAGHRVVNGARGFSHEISKALQLSVLAGLGLPGPKSRVIHRGADAPLAAEGLRFPVVIKPNVGGSGAGIVRFDTPEDLRAAAAGERIDLGFDHVGLVQEFIPARGGHIVRVECVGGQYLYAIKVHLSGETFDLCPADICRTGDGVALGGVCAVEAPKAGLRVDAYEAPPHIAHAVERILTTMGIDVGGVEYIVDDRDGELYFYDVNALSNFVADAPTVLGFEPHVRLVDYLLEEIAEVQPV